MLRSCPKCGNRNHISAFVCPCGHRLVGTPEPVLQTELEESAAPPYRNTVLTKSPELFKQPSSPASRTATREELEKQAVREALLAGEIQKPAREKVKIKLKNSFVALSLVILFGAMLAVLGGFIGSTEDSQSSQKGNEQTLLTDTSLAPDAPSSAANNPVGENSVEGKVIDVGSGDTITIADENNQEYQIKLEGIDAPELEQEFGREARKNLFTLVFGKTVQVNLRNPGDDGFTVGKVLLNGKNVSLEQLKAGLAWHDKTAPLNQSENDLHAYHETITKRNGFGLWAAANPLPPWEYRNRTNPVQDKNPIVVSDRNGRFPEIAPNAASESETAIFQEMRYAAESQTALIETAPEPAYTESPTSVKPPISIKSPTSVETLPAIKSPEYVKSPASVVVSPSSRKVLTVVSTGYERQTTPVLSRTATARCGDGTLSYSATRSESCAGRGGVAEWLGGSTPAAKTSLRDGNNNPAPRVGDCFVIERGKKVYLERELCGN